jgi:predicted RNA-binding Zn ribbon-like protein
MDVELTAEDRLTLQTERLCLDFANTLDWHASPHPVEGLSEYADLVHWAARIGLLTELHARQLAKRAATRPQPARAALRQAVALREAIYRTFSTRANGRKPSVEDLGLLSARAADAQAQLRLTQTADGFAWRLVVSDEALDSPLLAIARSAADLLTSPLGDRVGECADDRGCGWLFLDTSRNHSRRWCAMKDCGNRAKARRHYQRGLKIPATA